MNFRLRRSLRGWPKLFVEAWEVDQHGRNQIAGYGIIAIPFKEGFHELEIVCWRPLPSFTEKMIGSYPELEYKDILLASQSRHGFKTQSTGKVRIEVSVVLKDFNIHGISM